MNTKKIIVALFISIGLLSVNSNCSKSKNTPPVVNPPVIPPGTITAWITNGDKSALLQKQPDLLAFASVANTNPVVDIDSTITYQTIDGFGYTLTGGSAFLINRLPSSQKTALLQELFGNADNSIGISYLRISIGASDLSAEVFSYNDMPAGQTDVNLANFNLSKDTVDLIPLLKEILQVNPNIKLMGSPWSAPVWMKDNGSSIGGSLQTQYYNVYAQYFVKYILAMQAKGIAVDAITIQNEPQHGGNNPSMVMSALQQANFIKNYLGPAFNTAGITTKIIIWDHNCDNAGYPISILNDAAAKQFIKGSAFHLYSGDISSLSAVHNAHPDKDLYFTEQWTGANGSFAGDLKWHIKNVIVGSMRNWSRVALEWNLANDKLYQPHTPGGCTECKGALTIDGSAVTKNVGYYIIAHAAKFIPSGSVRIESGIAGNIYNAAFVIPDGRKILIAVNDGNTSAAFNIKFKGIWATTTLPAGGVGTYIW